MTLSSNAKTMKHDNWMKLFIRTVYAETKSDFYFKIKVEKVTNDEFNGNRKL